MKKYKSWKDVPNGTKFIVVKNSNEHDYPMHTVLIKDKDTDDVIEGMVITNHNYLSIKDVKFASCTLVDMQEEKRHLTNEYTKAIKELDMKIEFCEKNGLEEYDEKYAVVAKMLDTLEKPMTKKEKVKIIVGLLKEKF